MRLQLLIVLTSFLLVLSAVSSVSTGSVYSELVIDGMNPVVYWSLDESAGTTAVDLALAGGMNNGTYGGTYTLAAAGPRPSDGFATMAAGNLAPSATGNGYTVYDSLRTTAGVSPSAYSVQTWFKSSATALTDRTLQYIFARGNDDSTAGFKQGVYLSGSHLGSANAGKLRLYDGTATTPTGTRTLSPNTWYHLLLTQDDTATGSKTKVYLNGRLELEGTNAWAGGTAGDHLTAGHRTDYLPAYDGLGLYGTYDETAVWNRTLTAGEAYQLYLNAFSPYTYPATVLSDSPKAYWRLNETTGNNTAVDASGHGHDFAYNTGPRTSRTGTGDDVGPRPVKFGGFEAANNAPTLINTGDSPYEPLGKATGVWSGNDYSIEMWFRRDQLTSGGYGGGIVYLFHRNDDGTTGGTGDFLGLRNFGSGVKLFAFDGTGTIETGWQGTTTILENQWYYVALIREGDEVSVYLNGQLEIDTTMGKEAGYRWTGGTFTFGYRNDSTTLNQKFGGSLDEIAIYGRVLDPETIFAHWVAANVPEPSAISLAISAVAGVVLLVRRRKKGFGGRD